MEIGSRERCRVKRFGAMGLVPTELYLEIETAFPNFGSADYVTGLRDNVRPQRLVLILKRPVQEWLIFVISPYWSTSLSP